MGTIEIERDDWKPFFDDFARQHNGWFVTIEVLSEEHGDQIEVDDLPLQAISVEPADDCLEVTVAAKQGDRLSCTIPGPQHVWLKQADAETDEVLEVEAERGITLLHFHPQLGGHT